MNRKLVLFAISRYALLIIFLVLVALIVNYSAIALPGLLTAVIAVAGGVAAAVLINWVSLSDARARNDARRNDPKHEA